MPAGIGFREDNNILTNNNSEFIPHCVSTHDLKRKFEFSLNSH